MSETSRLQSSRIAPAHVRYIKLGANNAWAETSFENNRIEFGHGNVPHHLAASGDWDCVRSIWDDQTSSGKASDFLREVKDFYGLGSDCLWITFAMGRLWWAFAEDEVVLHDKPSNDSGSRFRRVIGGWRSETRFGQPLLMSEISTKLTKTASYRQTLCRVEAADYAIRLINGEQDPALIEAKAAQSTFVEALVPLIASLHEADFEVLSDLIMTRLGWVRVSGIGGLQKDTDFILEQPATGATALVQVKSSADQAVLDDYEERFAALDADRCFFICHSPRGDLTPQTNMHVWTGSALAQRVAQAGLVDWVFARAA
ncbi:MAG: hypothetical protein AAF292_14215 [Pseudomonadota bacterium]